MKKALITGITGQDGSYLADLLLKKGYEVHFISSELPARLDMTDPNIFFHKVNVQTYPLFKHQPFDIALSSTIYQVVKLYKLDILHAHYAIPYAYAAFFAKQMLKEENVHHQIATEIEKDVQRLRLVSDRFGKIGSTPQLEPNNVVRQVEEMVEYIRKRATGKVHLEVKKNKADMIAAISPPLFDWVIENLLKNALDAMDGKGNITVDMQEERTIIIDVTDTGKGIVSQNINRVFKPGFTTKKRGWGLGLSLSKRIIEQYHKGQLYVKHSEPGKGTTFRIVLKK